MRVISKKRLREFWTKHPRAKGPLLAWHKVALKADWASLQDVRQTYPSADAVNLECDRIITVFNIGGNNFRLLTLIIYPYRRIYVKLVLTHPEYDREAWKVTLCQ